MASEPASRPSAWEPSWRRIAGSSAVLFVVILAFLVGRVRAGADPGLAREASQARQQQSAPATPQAQPGFDPNFADPQNGQGFDPGTGAGGTTDNFGNAIPDDQGGGAQSLDPPSTHVS
jgi:hypothetical protein